MSDIAAPVLIVDDHGVMAESLALALRLHGFASVAVVTGDAIDIETVLAAVDAAGREVIVVLDLHLGDGRLSIPMIRPLSERAQRVLVLTADRDPRRLAECLEAGADGVFDKAQPFEQLVDLLRDAARGFSVMSLSAREELLELLRQSRMSADRRTERFDALTRREREVLAGLMGGRSAEEMARASGVALSTIRSHVKGVLRKLGVNSQLAAVALAREWEWEPVTEMTDGQR